MKPYGLFGNVVEHPDVTDIQLMGAKSSVGRLRGKGGDFKSYSKPSANGKSDAGGKGERDNRRDKISPNRVDSSQAKTQA